MKTCMVHDVEVKVGDWVGFKSDIEQSGQIVEIKKSYMGHKPCLGEPAWIPG